MPPVGCHRIVGIGAGAGGLAALKALFTQLPPEPGAAFVVVLHLPHHDSGIVDLLQPSSSMPFLEVTGTVQIENNRVYVIPPGTNLSAVDRRLQLSKLEADPKNRAPIDHFFRTLAETYEADAIGVVLTGAGSDGALGLRLIRELGGLALVEDPERAEHAGMPRSAIAAGAVDLVLPLERLAGEIVRLCREPPQLSVARDEQASAGETSFLTDILGAVRAHRLRDSGVYEPEAILRRVRRRMQLRHVVTPNTYLELVRGQPQEARALLDDLQLAATQFFGDRALFERLETDVVPRMLEQSSAASRIRTWYIGCSSGEEAYSLAMLMLEEAIRRGIDPHKIQIFASDLDERALMHAREGLYPAGIAEHVSPGRLRRFFVLESGRYRAQHELREPLVFSAHDLLQDPPFAHLDLIVCRRLLHELRPRARRSAVERLHYALNPGGFLLLGPSPPPITRSGRFSSEDGAVGLFRKTTENGRTAASNKRCMSGTGNAMADARQARARRGSDYSARHDRLASRYAPPSLLVDAEGRILHYSGHAGRYLRVPGGVPTDNLLELAHEPLRSALQRGLSEARNTRMTWQSELVDPQAGRSVKVRIDPDDAPDGEEIFLVVLENQPQIREAGAEEASRSVETLQRELDLSRQQLRAVLAQAAKDRQQLEIANEELQSANEELRAVSEELEPSRKELQFVNDELASLNEENRQRLEKLSQLSADLQHLLASTGIATLFLDQELRIVRFTPQVGELFNVRHEDRGRPLMDLTHRLGYSELEADARRVLDELTPVEREVRSESGRWYLTRVLPYRKDNGRADGVVITLIDITDRMLAEEALREADRRKDDFLATLAHELRNPLAPICVGLELLKTQVQSQQVRSDVHARLERQAAQLVRLVDDLLDVSRITRGKLRLKLSRVRLVEVVNDAVAASQPFIEKGRHSLSVSLPEEPIELVADAARLTQVLSNLLSNAAKYTPERGRIWIALESRPDKTLIRVKDTGIGIPSERLNEVFAMFEQIEDERERNSGGPGGLGIGLTLARSLVEMHGGTLTANSGGSGRGSEFTVELPMTCELVPSAAGPTGSTKVDPGDGAQAAPSMPSVPQRVLVVDDNEDAAETLSMLVGSLGVENVLVARDGIEALEQGRALQPEVVLLDLGMPRMDGFEAARRIRREPWGASVVLVALTGWGQESDRKRTRDAGFDHHLLKPASVADLQAILQRRRDRV